jgi:hypothetical protein
VTVHNKIYVFNVNMFEYIAVREEKVVPFFGEFCQADQMAP